MRERLRLSPSLVWLALLLSLAPAMLPAQGWAAGETPNAIIVIIDGARYSETFGDPTHRNIPHIWNDLRPQGTIHTGFYNHGRTVTQGAHATMLTGNDTWLRSPGNLAAELCRPATPTLFEYLRSAIGAEATQAWMVANGGMPSLEAMTFSIHPLYGAQHGASWRPGPQWGDDEDVGQEVSDIMDEYHPRLLMVNLHGTDRWAHQGNWARYNERIRNADNLTYLLWQKIQSDPFYADQTTLFVTTDHGRHSYSFRDHGDGCTGCQHVFFLALGPEIGRGVEISAPRRYLEDIGPTLGWLMGVPVPYVVDGEVMTELLSVAPPEIPSPYLPTDGLEVTIAVRDESGLYRTDFWPGETVFFEISVASRAASEVLLYQATARGGVLPDGEVGEFGWYFGEPPTFLSPGDYWACTYSMQLPSYTPLGEWPGLVEFRGVDAEGALVHGAASLSITIE